MTNAYFWQEDVKGGIEFGAQFEGHAWFELNRPDVVCAGCSVLSQALLKSLMDEGYKVRHRFDKSVPLLEFRVEADDVLDAERIEYMFKVCRGGFEMLKENYPENVFVSGEKPKKH